MGIASVLAIGLKNGLKTKAGKYVVSRDGKMFIDEKGGAEVALKDLDSDSLKQWTKDNTIYRGDDGAAPTEATLFDGHTKGHPATHASYDITEALSYAGSKAKPTDTPGVSEANLYSSANYPDTTRLLDYKTNPDELASIADTAMQNKGYKSTPDFMKARARSGDWQDLEEEDFVAEAKKRGYNMIRQSGEGDNVQIFPGAVPKTFAAEKVQFGDNLMLDPQNVGKLADLERGKLERTQQVAPRDAFINQSPISMSSNPDAFAAPMTRILHGGIRAGKTKDEIIAQAERFLPHNADAVGRNNIERTGFLDRLKTMPTDANGKPDQAKLGDWLKQTGLYSSAGVLGLGLASQSEDAEAGVGTIVSKLAEVTAKMPAKVRNAPIEQQQAWLRNQGVKEAELAAPEGYTKTVTPRFAYSDISPQKEAEEAEKEWKALVVSRASQEDKDIAMAGLPFIIQKQIRDGNTHMLTYMEDELVKRANTSDKSLQYFAHLYDNPKLLNTGVVDIGGHWADPSVFHVRGLDDLPSKTRRVYEIQSDLQNLKRPIATWNKTARENHFNELEEFESIDELPAEQHKLLTDWVETGDTTKLSPELQKLVNTLQQKTEPVNDVPFAYKLNWDKDAINRQFVEASEKGLANVDFLIKPVDNSMVRSPKVQARYETDMPKTIAGQATKIGAKTEEVTDAKGNKYLRVVLPAAGFSVPAFASEDEIKTDEKGNPYTSKRMTTEEYNQFIDKKATNEAARLAKKEQPQFVIDNAVADIQKLKEVPTQPPSTLVEQMRTAGYSNKEIYQAFADKGKTQDEIDKEFGGMLTKAKAQFTSPEDQALFDQDFSYAPSTNAKTLELPELTAQLEQLNRDNWSTGKTIMSLWDDKTAKEVQEYTSAIQPKLVEGLLKRGYQAKLMVQGDNGLRDAQEGEVPNVAAALDPKTKQFVPATSGFIAGLTAEALSITGGVAGAISGAELGMAAPIPHPLAKGAAVIGGAIVGGAAGTFAGSVADDLVTAAKLNEDFDAQKAVRLAAQAGLTNAIMDAGAAGLFKSPIAIGKLIKVTKRYLEDANVQGAYRALKDITGVTDQQADDYIKQVNAMSKTPLEGSQTRQRINAIAQTQKGAEAIVPQASQLSKSGGFNFAKEIDTRAKDFTASVDTVTPENVGKVITDDLAKYQQSVRDGYEGIKSFGIAQADSVGYHFDIDKFKIDSMLEDANVRITDPAVLQQFDTLMAKVKAIGANSSTGGPRSFSDLLDLRKTISDFKYKNGANNYIKLDRVNTVLNSIDGEIEAAAKVMPNGTQWLDEFAKSKVDYAQMKGLEKNALYKALNRPGISAEQVVSAVAQKAGSIDGTFMEVLGKLPMQTRVNAEGAVMKHLLGKHTIGDGQSYQAVDFPALVEKLDTLEFTTKENRELKRVAQEFARVFRNDKALAEASGAINVPKPTSYLATSVEGRLRVQAMSEMFNSFSKYLPTKEGRMKALADKVADVLDNPTNAKATETLLRELPDDPTLKESLSKLAIEYTKRGQKETYPQVTTYQVFNPGRTRDAMQTRLGKGMLYFTDEAKAKAYANGQGLQVKATQVEPTRFATPQQIEQITGEPFSMQQLRDPAVLSKLRVKGYTGVAEGDEVLEFNYRTP